MSRRRRLWRWLWAGPYRSFWAVTAAATFAWLQVATLLAEVEAGFDTGWAALGGFVFRFLAAALINLVAGVIWPVSWIYEMGLLRGSLAVLGALVAWITGRIVLALWDRRPAEG
jgi:hypothetical protein